MDFGTHGASVGILLLDYDRSNSDLTGSEDSVRQAV